MPIKQGLIPNMGDVSQATRVQLTQVGAGSRRPRRNGKRRKVRSSTSTGRKRGARTRTRAVAPRRARRNGSRNGRLKKGSPAAKRYMARIRKMRRK
jgi:hypothetical protein